MLLSINDYKRLYPIFGIVDILGYITSIMLVYGRMSESVDETVSKTVGSNTV